ncbi:hypothetical protein CBM2634_U170013 [Cupriavidus taiwanensis]|uniref:Transposase n=1 Tax=Cupriavidus taiwanensis TaxID=164546 RepID=A0A375JCQ1_9BURK|nr:hypothetical protein CBM2634_U170013 [Cupriavidus taiwanensis]
MPYPQCRGGLGGRAAKLHADKGYDFERCRRHLRKRGINPRIARRGIEKNDRLGKHRRVVERTHAWPAGFGAFASNGAVIFISLCSSSRARSSAPDSSRSFVSRS